MANVIVGMLFTAGLLGGLYLASVFPALSVILVIIIMIAVAKVK